MTRLRSAAAAVLTSVFIAAIAAAGSSAGSPSARQPLLGLVQSSAGGAALLAHLDPLSLRPVSRGVKIDEYHNTWSFSPDGSELALGVSAGVSRLSPSRRLLGRIGIYIVDVRTMRLIREIETGIAAEALAWLSPHVLVAALQRGTVLVDPLSGKVVRRWPAFSFPDASVRLGAKLVMLVPPLRAAVAGMPLVRVSGGPRLVTISVQGRLRSVALRRIRLVARSSGGGFSYGDRAALAVDQKRERAYVFAAGAPAAEVDLRTMHVSYHDLGFPFAPPAARERVLAREWSAIWLGDSRALVVGSDFVDRGGTLPVPLPAGATLVNTDTWTSRGIDPHAGGAAVAGRTLLLYGGSSPRSGAGIAAYTSAGRKRFGLLDRLRVADVRAAAGLAYVRTVGGTTYVISVAAAKVVGKIPPTREIVDLVAKSDSRR
jgi:hypothetical protein